MLFWTGLAFVLVVGAFLAGARRQARRDLRAFAAAAAVLPPAESTGAGFAAIHDRVARAAEVIAERDAEVERMCSDRETQRHVAEREQREVNARLRRRAKEAIDDTGAVITERLQDVVEQVGAAREAANATQERVSVTVEAAGTMVRRARSADEAATALNDSLREVAGIASVISEIASQTRMLALNATIEAARAGAAGKGFAVVAAEVKNLANTTADSTERIAATVGTLEADVAQMAQTLTAILQDTGQIETAMGLLDGIAGDQHQIVERLNSTVDATMLRIQDLSEVAERLERRRADRLSASGSVRLRLPGRPEVTGRLADVSADGLGCTVPSGTPLTVGAELQAAIELNGTVGSVTAKVVRRLDQPGGIYLGMELTDVGPDARRMIGDHISAALTATAPAL
ncbi:MAG: methyl-accepting chemotaxis protein [Actinoplanes sp.]